MRNCISIAALVLGGAMFIGCDSKDNTAATPPATPPVQQPVVVTPPMPDTTKTQGVIKNDIDKAAAASKTEADKLMNSVPSTMPTMK